MNQVLGILELRQIILLDWLSQSFPRWGGGKDRFGRAHDKKCNVVGSIEDPSSLWKLLYASCTFQSKAKCVCVCVCVCRLNAVCIHLHLYKHMLLVEAMVNHRQFPISYELLQDCFHQP